MNETAHYQSMLGAVVSDAPIHPEGLDHAAATAYRRLRPERFAAHAGAE
jgi:hypothetical protein